MTKKNKDPDRTMAGLNGQTCSVCGKFILPGPQWAYKIMKNKVIRYQCSYSHYKEEGGDSGKFNGYNYARG